MVVRLQAYRVLLPTLYWTLVISLFYGNVFLLINEVHFFSSITRWHHLISGVEGPHATTGGKGKGMGFGRGPGDQGSDLIRQETQAFVKEKTYVMLGLELVLGLVLE